MIRNMSMTRREILLSACALAGTSARMSAAQSRDGVKQPAPAPQSAAAAVSLSDFEGLARERVPRMAYEYISGGAADEITLRWNRESVSYTHLTLPTIYSV